MGLLDDAIREHLELKRRRGADPAEIERLEQEALGPARGAPDTMGALMHASREQAPYEADGGEDWAEDLDEPGEWEYETSPASPMPQAPPVQATAHGLHEPIAGDLASADFAEAAPGETQLQPELEDELHLDPAPPPPAAASPTPAAAPSAASRPHELGGETVEYDVDAEHVEDSTSAEDVLEETPEFLQDAPDHDRLWFEQRPPRDFDFDA